MMAGEWGAVYQFPERIIERQGYVNFLNRYRSDLLAWYIGYETGRLFGVWEIAYQLVGYAFKKGGEGLILDGSCRFESNAEFWEMMKKAPIKMLPRLWGSS